MLYNDELGGWEGLGFSYLSKVLCTPEDVVMGAKFGLWNQKENCTRNKGIELNYILGLYLYTENKTAAAAVNLRTHRMIVQKKIQNNLYN